MSYQIRHKEWGVFQGQGRPDKRAVIGFWTAAYPDIGVCKFETREDAQGFIDLVCRFARGTVKPVNEADFSIEPFDENLAALLGGVNTVRYWREVRWTAEYPTKPGAYWIRNYRFRHYRNGQYIDDAETNRGPRLVDVNAPYSDFYYFGIETPEHREMLVCAEWYGPIQPPE